MRFVMSPTMQNSAPLCTVLLDASQTAFSDQKFMVAYHSLSAALYCCLSSKDSTDLETVLRVAGQHVEELEQHFGNPIFPDEPTELSLYLALVQVARTRLLLSRS